ncbi:2-polyprenyl-6-methoxyphenol hydroxylase [Brevibacterium iodinum ATCC 49514]|uniref:2-polyprenyl-6-methoxyphenol hydroxylase n=1 Tax=Brevibacterium iodinum ATCC 49514 TaxID=1255616 RepID=A0A2H1IIX6_9MICO|nr:NAD(P)/FAD-dependent oxidoreductase [Brevibacterium iodinum]SMX75101.1 2-polyprenyl-6-methoxyphenol hydroxylase [Brevibacterium iodinum ATCC 49514]SUW12164.1 6-hydroxynicotinate 3-monooxygenase precursor [Brevibacterium iodinum]
MITSVTVDDQLKDVSPEEPRILIVGAGIAGITLAQLLRGRGMHPVLIDRSADSGRMIGDNRAGYMLALMPMVDPIIDELDCREAYLESSVGIDRYIAHAHTGRVLRQDRLGDLLADYGDYRGISRAALLDVLTASDCSIAFGTTVTELSEVGATVTLAQGGHGGQDAEHDFDVVVIADGMNSRTRGLVTGKTALTDPGKNAKPAATGADVPLSVSAVDTTWGGWVCWAEADDDQSAVDEILADGFFLGMYPVKDGIGVFLGCPDSRQPLGPRRFAAEVRSRLTVLTPRIDACLTAVEEAESPFFWPLRDSRAHRWCHGRTVLLGDAAAGFLPTAGIGAGMAMESAGVLAGELSALATRPSTASSAGSSVAAEPVAALERFEARQRPRVEAAHDNSRSLARLMFGRSRLFAFARDQAFRVISIRSALKPILQLLESPPERM